MARKNLRDPLRYAANLIGLGTGVYVCLSMAFSLLSFGVVRLFHKNATLQNPIAVPEWVLGLLNLAAAALCLCAALWVLCKGAAGPLRVRFVIELPRDKRVWLFLPVFLGAGVVTGVCTTQLQRFLTRVTAYQAPESIRLPESGWVVLLYFIALCIVPAILEELLVRGAMQGLLRRWGVWFSIVVSSVAFTLLHGDVAQMPSVFVLSILLGLCAHCTGSLFFGMVLHFANNVTSFALLYAAQKIDGVSALAFSAYLITMYCFAAVSCGVLIHKNKLLHKLERIPRVCDPKNRQSRLERLASSSVFLAVMLLLAIRALLPLWGVR